MKTFKVVDVVKSLTLSEIEHLRRVLSIETRGKGTKEVDLFNALCKYRGKKNLSIPELKERCKLSDKQLNDISSRLLKNIEPILISSHLDTSYNHIDYMRGHLDFLITKKLTNQFYQLLGKYRKIVDKEKLMFSNEFLSVYRFYKTAAVYEKLINGRKVTIETEALNKLLSSYFYLEKIKLLCENINRRNVIDSKAFYSDTVFDEARLLLIESPVVFIFERIYDMLRDSSRITVPAFQELFHKAVQLPKEKSKNPEVVTIFHYMMNICLQGIKSGESKFRQCFLDIVIHLKERELLLERGIISSMILKTTISISLKDNQIEFAKNFLNDYGVFLNESNRSDVLKFLNALTSFYANDFGAADVYLSEIHRPNLDVYFIADIKVLEIKILTAKSYNAKIGFLDSSSYDRIDNLLDNLSAFIRRTPTKISNSNSNEKTVISKVNKVRLLNFVSYTRKVLNTHSFLLKRKELNDELLKESHVSDRDWLLSILK